MPISLDSDILFDTANALIDAKVKYKLGAKANVHKEASAIKEIDCSGFVQFVIYKASSEQTNFQGGSVWQREKCDNLKLDKVDYSTAAENDGWLRIAFIKKSKTVKVGHVWLIHSGSTLESYGGNGPGRRAWDTDKLKNNVYACYKLSQIFVQLPKLHSLPFFSPF